MRLHPHDRTTRSLNARARIVRFFLAGIGAAACASSPAFAGPPAGFSVTTVASGFELPTAHAYASDGRLFVAEKSGRVFVQQPGLGGTRSTFLDLRASVNDYGERGLTGIALDRDFASNRRMYLLYVAEQSTSNPDSSEAAIGRVMRVEGSSSNPNVEDSSKRAVLLTGFQAGAPNHVTGTIRIDSQNRVLAGFGDGNRDITAVQSLDQLNGKIVRIDASTGAGVPGNPYYDAANPTSVRSKVLATGFRNPFRFTVDPATGEVWVGDVGQNTWEELNRIPATWTSPDRELNFGWPCFEGGSGTSNPYPGASAWSGLASICVGLTGGTAASQYAYNHSGSSAGASITGGPVYRGQLYPSSFVGRVFFADYARDQFQTLTPGGAVASFGSAGDWGNPVDIVSDPSGDISYVAIGEGAVRTIVYSGSNHPPLISTFSATPTSGEPPILVRFAASATDSDADSLTYRWAFGDGSPIANGAAVEHVYSTPGSFDATLTVSDGRAGGTTTKVTRIDAGNNAPKVSIKLGAAPTYRVGQAIAFSLQASDPEDGALNGSSVTWRVSRVHLAHSHPVTSGTGITGSLVVDDHGDDPGYLELVARATDRYGSSAQATVRLDPERVQVQITGPAGAATINVDGEDHLTPFRLSSVIGGSHRIVAAALSKGQAFSGWQIFGRAVAARETEFTTPASGGSIVARYGASGDPARGPNSTAAIGGKTGSTRTVRVKVARGPGWIAAAVTSRVRGQMTVVFTSGKRRVGQCQGIQVKANRVATCRVTSDSVGRGAVEATAVVRTAAGRNLRSRFVLRAAALTERAASLRGRW